MDGLIYLFKTTFKNRVLRAFRKPVTYIYLIIGILYCVFMFKTIGISIESIQFNNPEGLVLGLSFFTLFFMPPTYISYAKRKGIIFKPGDVHFVFTSPVNPKMVLLFAYLKQYLLGFLFTVGVCIFGIAFFHIPPVIMAAYFLLSFVVENVLESSLIVILYGNETLKETQVKFISRLLWAVIGVLILFGLYLFIVQEPSVKVITLFLNHPVVQCVPFIGWNIAFIRLLLLGPTVVNVVCTILYCISAVILFCIARRMKCTGGYYEEAMKFADDYQEMILKKRKGEVQGMGKKRVYKKAQVQYKGSYAKAIFYRQLLEYKKSKYFIFGMNTIFCLGGGIVIAYLMYKNNMDSGMARYYLVPGVGAYFTLIFSGYATKWSKEMENPYTYLIPDSPIKKLWYATVMEHIRAVVDGCLLAVPPVIVMRASPVMAVLYVMIYVSLQANKLYLNVLAEVLLGNILGNLGKQIFRMAMFALFIGIAAIVGVIGTFIVSMEVGFLFIIVFCLVETLAIAIGGSMAFTKMEIM